jgi:hypothetical protein
VARAQRIAERGQQQQTARNTAAAAAAAVSHAQILCAVHSACAHSVHTPCFGGAAGIAARPGLRVCHHGQQQQHNRTQPHAPAARQCRPHMHTTPTQRWPPPCLVDEHATRLTASLAMRLKAAPLRPKRPLRPMRCR